MQGVDAVAHILKQEGVEYLFSYPNNQIIDSAAKIGIRPIIARSEKTLINIADGYSRSTNGNKPSLVVVQAGPGTYRAQGSGASAKRGTAAGANAGRGIVAACGRTLAATQS